MQDGESNNSSWWRDSLAREITLVLVVKIALIFALWWFFFDLPDNQHIDATQVGSHLVGTTPTVVHLSKEELK
jgi:hypothetical protein